MTRRTGLVLAAGLLLSRRSTDSGDGDGDAVDPEPPPVDDVDSESALPAGEYSIELKLDLAFIVHRSLFNVIRWIPPFVKHLIRHA